MSGKKKKQDKPRGIMCYICGREYFQKSINIHIEQCKVKFLNEQKKKPKGERKKLPAPPQNFDDVVAGKMEDKEREAYNDEAFNDWNTKQLDKCEGCGRTFLPESLLKHQKGCKGMKGKAAASPGGGGSPGSFGGGKSGGFGDASASPKKAKGGAKSRSPGRGPVAIICHICG